MNHCNRPFHNPAFSPRKNGIALIATLGLLSALLIMALGYAAVMRTERTAAANSTAIAQTRLLTLGMLDSTINDINTSIWPGAFPTSVVEVSTGPHELSPLIFGTLGRGGTKHFIPTRWLGPDPGNLNIDGGFLDILSPGGELVGVYARAIVDESGNLDFNYAGLSPYVEGGRNGSTNLFLDNLSNIDSSWNDIATVRSDAYRYYNQAELKFALGTTHLRDTSSWPNDDFFTTYGRYGQYYNVGTTVKPRVDISGTFTSIAGLQTQIIGALGDAGFTGAEAADLYTCMLDYTDSDDLVAAGPLAFGSEAVPMISELVVSNSLSAGGGFFTNTYQYAVELWYPFVGPTNTKPYRLIVNARYDGALPAIYNPPAPQRIDESFTITNRFMVFWSNPVTMVDTNPPVMGGAKVEFVGGGVVDVTTGRPVDQIPSGPGVTLPIGVNLNLGDEDFDCAEVDDPRINWRLLDWDTTPPETGTLGDTNSISIVDGDGDIYIANGPFTNVGDLGFVALGGNVNPAPWTSVELVGIDRQVLDVFTMQTNAYVHGLVNPNSQDDEVLATALFEAAIENYPGDPAGSDLNWGNALVLASNIVLSTSTGGFFTAKSELTLVPELTNNPAQITENQQESLIRQVADLMDVRGNTHTIILGVRSVRDRTSATDNAANGTYEGPTVDITLGEQMAVAQVWRDPISKESKVTFFKWVTRSD